MKNLFILRHLFFCCLIMAGITLPAITRGQTVVISGDIDVCVGDVVAYTPDIANASFNYAWAITPAVNGTVLSGNSTGANIQWNIPGAATINLTVTDPQNGNAVVFTGSLGIVVHELPTPYVTADILLGCQPLNEDSLKGEQGRPPVFDPTHCQLVCSYSTVLYTANGSPGSTFTWSAPGAVSVTPIGPFGLTCSVEWGAPGFGEVHVTETTAAGCQAESFFCVQIVESPVAKFVPQPDDGSDPLVVCLHGEVVLLDQSTGSTASPIVSWLWIWGDGQQTTTSPGSIGNPVTHQYDSVDAFTITLVVTNSCGCTDTFQRKVKVMDPPAPKIACPRVVCEGERAVYTIDQPCAPDSWSVQGGTILSVDPVRLEVVWDNVDPNTGFGYVMYRSCAPCPMTVTEEVPVILRNAKIQGPASICLGGQYVYRLPKWPATEFNWVVSGPGVIQPTDQRNETALTATGVGTITLTVKYRNTVLGCEGSSQIQIEVLPTGVINGDNLFCQGEFRAYDAGGPSGDWTLRDPSNAVVAMGTGPTFGYTFPAAGVYRLSVSSASFCPPPDYLITVVGIPAAADVILGPDRACPSVPIRYDAGNPVPGTTFAWSVSGGGSATAATGDYSYITFATVPATIQVVRVTTDEARCASSPIFKDVDVAVPPLTITGNDTVCHSTEEMYILDYEAGDLYEWTISPATLGSVVLNGNTHEPTILWNVPSGTGAVATLTAKVTKCGSDVFQSFTVFVRGTPAITSIILSEDTVCSGTPVTVNVYTSYPVNSATEYTWQWGDGPGTSIPGFPPGYPYVFTHTYFTDGGSNPVAFTPSITIRDANGCLGTVSGTAPPITVMPRPIALISPSGPIEHCGTGWTEIFTATETTGIGGSNTYTWAAPAVPIGSGTSASTSSYGSYSVTVANDIFGCSSTSNIVFISENCGPGGGCGPAPSVTLTSDTADCGAITVNALVGGGATGFDWILPSGVTGVGLPSSSLLNATASAAGLYTIKYRVYYAPDCYDDESINVLVPYIPDLRYEISCNQPGGNYTITLYDHSTQYPTTPITNRDYYGAGFIGSGMSVTTTQAGGTTQIYYQVIQRAGMPACTSYVSVTTPSFPTTNISLASGPNPGCAEDVVFNFNQSSTGTGIGYWWDFGDFTNNATAMSPVGKIYSSSSTGLRTVTLTVTDEYGCYASDNESVTVVPNPYEGDGHFLTAAPNPVCQGNPATLTYLPGSGGAPNVSYTWYEQSNPLYTTYYPTTTYNVFEPGGYWVNAVDNFGCKASTANQVVAVNVVQVPAISISGNANQCVNQAFTLNTQDYGNGSTYTYTWSGAGSGSGTSITPTLGSPGTYTYYVTITDMATSCSRISPAFTVTVSPAPAPPSLSFSVLACDPYELQLTASGGSGSYNWSNGMSGPVITTPFGGPYQVTLTDLNGCRVQNSIATPSSPAEYLWVFPTGCFCRQQIKEPYVIGPIVPFSYWAWLRNGGVSASGGGYMPNYFISPGNVYNMELNNGYCSVTSGDMYYDSDTCANLAGRPADATQPIGSSLGDTGDYNALQLAPNPTREQATVTYRFASGSGKRSIELIDIVGRRLQTVVVDKDKGSVILPMDKYAAGMYQVVMRRDGVIVQQSKLSVSR